MPPRGPIFRLARFRVRPDKVMDAKRAIMVLVDAVKKKEAGTLLYESWVEEDGVTFFHLMGFANETAEAEHEASDHVKRFGERLLPLCDAPPAFVGIAKVRSSRL